MAAASVEANGEGGGAAVSAAADAISGAELVLNMRCHPLSDDNDWQQKIDDAFEMLDEVCLLLLRACTRVLACVSADATIFIPGVCSATINAYQQKP